MLSSPFYKGFTLKVQEKKYKSTGNWREDYDSSGNPILESIVEKEVEKCYMQRLSGDESSEYGISLNVHSYKIHIPKKHDISTWKGNICSFGQGDFSIVFTSLSIPNIPKEFSHSKFIIVEDTRNG